jgi:hypothetical protein
MWSRRITAGSQIFQVLTRRQLDRNLSLPTSTFRSAEEVAGPKTYTTAIERYPELMKAYHGLAEQAQQAGC